MVRKVHKFHKSRETNFINAKQFWRWERQTKKTLLDDELFYELLELLEERDVDEPGDHEMHAHFADVLSKIDVALPVDDNQLADTNGTLSYISIFA